MGVWLTAMRPYAALRALELPVPGQSDAAAGCRRFHAGAAFGQMLVIVLVGQVFHGQAQAVIFVQMPGGAQVDHAVAGGGVFGAARK